jgi:mannose-6-phosphate isomerase-like protein (cupin superfamily)
MSIVSTYTSVVPYITKDGSLIRELMHPVRNSNRSQSLAEATVLPGCETLLHRHRSSEELYHVSHGIGLMTVGAERFEVEPGDTVCIPPGTPHRIRSIGPEPLVILCACSPAYSHDDTELLASEAPET